uniref:Uncharacterized protein n=3 Tax=Ciona intestinalis TaxID=7719 RepID=F6PIE5_CIOIN
MKNNLTNNIPEEKLDNGISDLPLHKDGALLIPISSRKLVVIRSPSSSSVSSHEPTTRIKSNNLHSKKKLTQRDALHSAGGTGVCSLGKHRTVDGRATLLTPTHAAKLYGVDSNNKLKPSNLFNNEVKRKHTVSFDSVSSSNVGQDDSMEGCFVSDVDSFHTDASFNSLMLPHFPGVGINMATTCSNFPQTVAVNTSTANMGIEHLANSNQNVEHEVYNLQQTQTVQDRKHQLASASLVFNTFSTDDETESVITNMTTDKEEDSEESSLSSTSFDQGLSMLSNEYSANNSTVDEMVCKCEHEQCNTKRKELAQDLKLAEADIAILVSSKQQLQLDIYEISEEKNKLYDQLKTSQTELAVRDKELKFFKKQMESKMEVWETHKTSMNEYVKQLKLELSETSQLLELTQVDRDRNKNELNEKKREVENVMNRNKSLQEECSEMHGKVLRLESFIEKSSNENVESENNFSQLRLVREEYSMQLLTKDRQLADTKNQLQKVEDRLLLTNEAHDKLKNESANVRKALMMQTSSVNQLQSQLSIKSEEKHSLDAVVAKLHKDLFHVEMCLTKLKQEISDKSNIVAREEGVKQQLEMQRKVFKEERVSFKQETQLLKQRIMEKKNEVVELQRKVVKGESEHVRTKEEMQKLTEKTKLHADHLACQVKENAQTCSEYEIKYEKLQCLYQDAVTVKDKSQSELEKTIAKFERKEEELLRLQKELAMMSEKLKQNTLLIELKNKESLKWKEHLQIVTNERDKQVVEVTQLRQNVLMQQQNVGRADHSHEQKEMLAELQTTKLNLIAKVEQMQLVEDKMKTEMLKQEENLMK